MLAWVLQLGKSKMEIFSLFVQMYLKKSAVKISKVRDRFLSNQEISKGGERKCKFRNEAEKSKRMQNAIGSAQMA